MLANTVVIPWQPPRRVAPRAFLQPQCWAHGARCSQEPKAVLERSLVIGLVLWDSRESVSHFAAAGWPCLGFFVVLLASSTSCWKPRLPRFACQQGEFSLSQ